MSDSRRPDENTWRQLMKPALRVIDSLQIAGYGELDFRVGGGTVLMFRFNHRISKDIDIFTHDAQALGYLSPRLNEVAETEAALGYQEQANALKLVLPDGDVDFIVAAPVIRDAPREAMVFEGRTLALDATSEILAKKLLYRADGFTARDVFDMAAALVLDEASAMAALRATTRTRAALLRRLDALAKVTGDELMKDIVLTEAGRQYAKLMVQNVAVAVLTVQNEGEPEPAHPRPDKVRLSGMRETEG